MILIKYRFALIGLALFVISCTEDTSKKREEYQNIYDQVQTVHDKLMAKMTTDVYDLSKKMETMADSSAPPTKYEAAEQQLKASDSVMMSWMEHFGDEFVKNKSAMKDMDDEQLQVRIDSINQELKKVKEMQVQMNSSIENARKLAEPK